MVWRGRTGTWLSGTVGTPVLGLGASQQPRPRGWQGALAARPLPLLWPCKGWPGPLWGFSTLSRRVLNSVIPSCCLQPHSPAQSVPWLANGLIQEHPRPGTALLGTPLSGQGGEHGEAGSSQALAPGWPRGSVRGPGSLLSPPRAFLVLGPRTWFIRGQSRRSSHVVAEAVLHSWQPASGW